MAGLAMPTPYQWNVGDIISQSLLTSQLYNGLTFLENPPLAIYQQSSAQSIANGSTTALTWPTPTIDTYGGYNSANPTRYTATQSGYYLIAAQVSFATNGTGHRLLQVNKNGSATNIQAGSPALATSQTSPLSATGFVFFNGTTDYIEAIAFQASGGPLNTQAAQTALNAVWIHA